MKEEIEDYYEKIKDSVDAIYSETNRGFGDTKDLIETSIKAIKAYFIAKILNLDFEVIGVSDHVLSILIDNTYDFNIWIANEQLPTTRKPYNALYQYFMRLEFTDDQAIELDSKIWPIVEKAKKKFMYPNKLEQFNKLKEELGL